MNKKHLFLGLFVFTLALGQLAYAQEGETWETQEKVYNVVLVKIHPNADEQYLNNLKKTWVTGVKESMKEGLVTDYKILSTITPYGEGYNLLMITEHPNLASFDATDAWRAKIKRINDNVEKIISEEESEKITATVYPEVRTLLSDKLLREIKYIEK